MKQAENTARALDAIETAMAGPTIDDMVCAKCGTDQVAMLCWRHPYGAVDPYMSTDAYPRNFCAECGPVEVVEEAAWDASHCAGCDTEIVDTNRDTDDDKRCRFCAGEYRDAQAEYDAERYADAMLERSKDRR